MPLVNGFRTQCLIERRLNRTPNGTGCLGGGLEPGKLPARGDRFGRTRGLPIRMGGEWQPARHATVDIGDVTLSSDRWQDGSVAREY
jgi:hypothetical protein